MVRGIRPGERPAEREGASRYGRRPALDLRGSGYDLTVEDHPQFTFHFAADLPPRGRLAIRDTNYEAGEGTSRLALRGLDGVKIVGDGLPGDVAQMPVRPVWQLTDAEERRTRQVDAAFEPAGDLADRWRPSPCRTRLAPEGKGAVARRRGSFAATRPFGGVGRLPLAIALSLGAAHAVQPGHGKSLVAAASVGERGGWARGTALALTITVAHVGGVLAVAVALWATRSSRYPDINRGLAHGAGFVIAAIGLWRLGRHLGGYGEHADDRRPARRSSAPAA